MKTLVYCLELNGITAIYFCIEDLLSSIEYEFENIEVEGKYSVYTKEMTDEEINNLPEFEGF